MNKLSSSNNIKNYSSLNTNNNRENVDKISLNTISYKNNNRSKYDSNNNFSANQNFIISNQGNYDSNNELDKFKDIIQRKNFETINHIKEKFDDKNRFNKVEYISDISSNKNNDNVNKYIDLYKQQEMSKKENLDEKINEIKIFLKAEFDKEGGQIDCKNYQTRDKFDINSFNKISNDQGMDLSNEENCLLDYTQKREKQSIKKDKKKNYIQIRSKSNCEGKNLNLLN